MATRITLGTDPEFLVTRDRRVVPICGLIGGTKDDPKAFKGRNSNYFYHEDGVAAEIGVPAQSSAPHAASALGKGRRYLTDLLSEQGLGISTRDAHAFRSEDLRPHPQAFILGCDPDYNAYLSPTDPRKPPTIEALGRLRVAGGHVHIGGEFNCPPFVAAMFMDAFVGIPALMQHPTMRQSRRVPFYGMAGLYRPKPYGIEYRTLSNQWCHSMTTAQAVFENAERCARFLSDTRATLLQKVFEAVPWIAVADFINTPVKAQQPASQRGHDLLNLIGKAGVPV